MRINKFVAQSSGLSRRLADTAIASGRVQVNNILPAVGQNVTNEDRVTLDGSIISLPVMKTTIMLNKPVGYVCSRNGQGNLTIYDLLSQQYYALKPVGRLDKDSSGLLLLTNDGQLANELTHPSYAKEKVYQVILDKTLLEPDKKRIEQGIPVEDYVSRLELKQMEKKHLQITMHQGHNRQIRRTFAELGYKVTALQRTKFGDYELDNLASGALKVISE